MIIGRGSATPGAGSDDTNATSNVLAAQTGPGSGTSAPVEFMPPYFALTFCKLRRTSN
jgi:hypothetical protein